MSDLISRSELLNTFNNKNIQITFDLPVEEILGEDVDLDDFAMLVQDAIRSYKKLVIDTINDQPTAYDIDKVVEELEEYLKSERNFNDIIDTGSEIKNPVVTRTIGRIEAFEKSIEIVKQGGVSDDVCEWKKVDEEGYQNCKSNYDETIPDFFKYCPYCGKKIKVVK